MHPKYNKIFKVRMNRDFRKRQRYRSFRVAMILNPIVEQFDELVWFVIRCCIDDGVNRVSPGLDFHCEGINKGAEAPLLIGGFGFRHCLVRRPTGYALSYSRPPNVQGHLVTFELALAGLARSQLRGFCLKVRSTKGQSGWSASAS